jgi:hypothetical protein
MKRFLYCAGAVGVLVSASLMLPVGASASPGCGTTATGFQIEETSTFLVVPEIFGCFIPASISAPVSVDLLETPTSASDYVNLQPIGGITAVTLQSDTGPLAPRGVPTIPETGTESVNGAVIPSSFFGGHFDFTVHSDVAPDIDPVPEPPTGLLMGVAGMLPLALTYLKRRGTRRQPSAA